MVMVIAEASGVSASKDWWTSCAGSGGARNGPKYRHPTSKTTYVNSSKSFQLRDLFQNAFGRSPKTSACNTKHRNP